MTAQMPSEPCKHWTTCIPKDGITLESTIQGCPYCRIESLQQQLDWLQKMKPLPDAEVKELQAEVERLSEEAETMRMQAAACMTACIQNTRESVKERIGRDNPYWTQAYGDVCDAVDREMRERERAETAERKLAEAVAECERLRLFVSEVAESVVKPEYADGMNRLGIAEDCKAVARNEMSLHYLEVKYQMERAIEAERKLAEYTDERGVVRCRNIATCVSTENKLAEAVTALKKIDDTAKSFPYAGNTCGDIARYALKGIA